MNVTVEKKFAVEVVYNGITKSLEVEAEERVSALLQKAIQIFRITQNPHLLSLFRQDGSVVPENESLERAGVKPCETLLLRPNAVKGGAERIRLRGDIVGESFRLLRECGRGECECVLYWTGPAGEQLVDGVEHPVHDRSPFVALSYAQSLGIFGAGFLVIWAVANIARERPSGKQWAGAGGALLLSSVLQLLRTFAG